MEIAAIQALITSLKTAAEASKALLDLKPSSEVQSKVAELQSALLAAQNSALAATSAQFELQERVRTLESQLRAAEAWRTTRSRYALVSPWKGAAQVYALRKAESDGEAPHFACTNCFEGGKRIILNPVQAPQRRVMMSCPSCKAMVDTGYSGIAAALYAEEYSEKRKSSA
jgi:hypothetical protein